MAIYLSTFLSPKNSCIDMATNQDFSCQVNGTVITDYQIIIYKVSDNTVLYDSTKLHLTTSLYDKETLTHTITGGTVTYRGACKWTIKTYSSALYTTTTETLFYNQTTPTLTFSPSSTITSKLCDFTATYAQTESIALKRFKFIWADSASVEIEDSDWIYSANIHYEFDGFTNGTSYKVKCITEDQLGIIVDSGYKDFTVSYTPPSLTISPTVTLLADKSAIKIEWSNVTQILGVVSGTSSYVDDFLVTNNHGLQLDASSSIEFTLDIPEEFTTTIVYQPDATFTSGIMVRLGTDYDIGYDGTRFYFNNGGTAVYGIPITLPTTPFLIAIRSQDVLICDITSIDESFSVDDSLSITDTTSLDDSEDIITLFDLLMGIEYSCSILDWLHV